MSEDIGADVVVDAAAQRQPPSCQATALPGQTLRLRPLHNSDESLFIRLYSDASALRHIEPMQSFSRNQQRFQYCLQAANKVQASHRFFAAELTASGETIGILSIIDSAYAAAPVELGIMLLAEFRGKTLADQALALLCRYAMQQLHSPAVLVRFHPSNKGARTLNIRLGFQQAPVEMQDQSGLLCWWLTANPTTLASLTRHSSTAQLSNDSARCCHAAS